MNASRAARWACLSSCALLAFGLGARADDVPPEAVVAIFPFGTGDRASQIVLNIAADGTPPCELLVATGSSYSAASGRAISRLNEALGRIGRVPFSAATALQSGWLNLHERIFHQFNDKECSGVIGGSLLRDYVVDLDFAAKRVRFLDPLKFATAESTQDPQEAVIPIQMHSDVPSITIEIDRKPVDVFLATEAFPAVALSNRSAARIGIDTDALPRGLDSKLVGRNTARVRPLEVTTLRIGGLGFESVPGIVAPHDLYFVGGHASDSGIGYDLISSLRVRIDYARRRLWIRKESSTVRFLGVDYAVARQVGVLIFPTDLPPLVEVIRVLPGTPAERMGLLPGDIFAPHVDNGSHLDERQIEALRWGKSCTSSTPIEITEAIRAGEPVRILRNTEGRYRELDLQGPTTTTGSVTH
ncbi:MAG TPA: hypothetical protein VMH82_09725 [Myxococcota bacterium]|nr:hypothetical protein [Myxococcota bacterium]